MGKRRSRLEIIRDILEVIKEGNGVSKTDTVYGANLNFSRADEYLSVLIDKELVEERNSSQRRYYMTKKGLEFMRQAENLLEVL